MKDKKMIELENNSNPTESVENTVSPKTRFNITLTENNIEIDRNILRYSDENGDVEMNIKFNPFTGEKISTTFEVDITYNFQGRVVKQETDSYDYEEFDDMSDEDIEYDMEERLRQDLCIDFSNSVIAGSFTINRSGYEEFEIDEFGYEINDLISDYLVENIEITVNIRK